MSSSEKTSLPLPTSTAPVAAASPSSVLWSRRYLLLGFATGLFFWKNSYFLDTAPHFDTTAALASAKCPAQPAPLNIGEDWNPLTDSDYADLAANRLSAAVKINTVSFDNLPLNGSDPIFDKHYAFASWMEKEYPKLFTELKHELVNYHGHIFTWEGTNPSLKPILLMAHTDTVPVLPATLGQWTYPPFEGSITHDATSNTPGTWIWGRGSSDCKNSLLGIYGAVEKLVLEGYKPERTIIISNGFDEEIGGIRGSKPAAELLVERYGNNGIAFLVDEGFTGISEEYGTTIASLGMAEKGATNVHITVETLGGHSSVPPSHTGIGIISLLLAELEKNPFEPSLNPQSPYLKYLSCLAEYAEIPSSLKKQIETPKKWKKLAKSLASSDRKLNSFLATTQAIDLISGGVKVNALPEFVEATVNYRISFTSSIQETLEHVSSVLVPLAHSLNFTISAFDSSAKASPFHIRLETPGAYDLEPAPITSSDTKAFELIAGTTKHVFGAKTVVSPTGMYANTDTSKFWNVTDNLYRFTPAVVVENLNQHTVDERISLEGHLNTTRFFYKLLRNAEGWNAE